MKNYNHTVCSPEGADSTNIIAEFCGEIPIKLERHTRTSIEDVIAGLSQANVGLVMAARFYESGLVREAFRCALMASIDFFKDIGAPAEQTAPLLRLEAAIADLDRGAIDPAFKTEKKSGRPQDSHSIWARRAYLVIALETEIYAGKSVPTAIKSIEQHISKLRQKTLSRKTDTQALESWRKKFISRELSDRVQDIYDCILEVIKMRIAILDERSRIATLASYRDYALKMADASLPEASI